MFTLEEAKGHGLVIRVGGEKELSSRLEACPFTRPPQPCEGSGSKPGGLLQVQAGADLGGLIVKPSSYFLLCCVWG